jgi:3-oxoacyl-[acyl-carrier protein] reductase
MNLDLTGKRAVVCGSTQGIGKASAVELAQMGADVTLIARDEQKLKAVVQELPGKGKHNYLVADFSSPEELKQKITEFAAKNPIHILINNTGGPPGGQAIDAQTEDFVKAFSNHLLCNHILVQAVVPSMKKEKFGRIVNIISTSVKIPIRGLGSKLVENTFT